ncbi:MAG: FliH/SctL family protein [Pseudomonadota bacterium]|nr:FliH/SctL family protein [Pseudomonadota bacterium]
MSVPILFGQSVLDLPSARIARADVKALRDTQDLLKQAQRIRDETAAQAEAARAEGYEEGKRAAREELAQHLGDALGELSDGFARENARRSKDVSAAAIEVIQQLIGQREAAETVAGLTAQALARTKAGETAVVIQLSPDMVEPVRARLEASPDAPTDNIRIEANASLSQMGCRIVSGDGVIIADLDTQLETLRKRWGGPT